MTKNKLVLKREADILWSRFLAILYEQENYMKLFEDLSEVERRRVRLDWYQMNVERGNYYQKLNRAFWEARRALRLASGKKDDTTKLLAEYEEWREF